jgi:hypothetical protein
MQVRGLYLYNITPANEDGLPGDYRLCGASNSISNSINVKQKKGFSQIYTLSIPSQKPSIPEDRLQRENGKPLNCSLRAKYAQC